MSADFVPIIPAPLDHPDRAALKRIGRQVRERLAANPAIYAFPCEEAELFAMGDFLSSDECVRMIAMIDAIARPSTAFDVAYSTGYRTSYSGDPDADDPLVRRIQRRFDDLLGIDPDHGETIQGQRYLPGQQFQCHTDWFPPDTSYWEQEKAFGGQRCYTAMVFLNEVEEGGHTHFPRLHLSIEPKPGALLIWNNADRDGVPNPWTIHAGTPVARGVKHIITKWYRVRPWQR